ncbi:MAG: acyl--CoA ligase [Steroidobacteraceae bacterium]|nr:acyl--CoA ligase [Steroidobacteraceae bacterium]
MTEPTLTSLLDAAAQRRPDAPALSWKAARWSYAQLSGAAAATAAFLQTHDVAQGERVALLFRNSPHYVAAYYGALAAGCVTVPLNPHEHAQVLARQMEHSQARLLLGDPAHPEWSAIAELASAAGAEAIEVPSEDDAGTHARYLKQMGGPAAAGGAGPAPDALATIIYTSGTTGRPKGVMLSHRNLAANTAAIVEYLGLTPEDRGIAVLPFQFSYGNSVLHMHLSIGAELLLEDSIAYPHAVLQRMADEGVTGFSGVPSTFALLLSRCELPAFDLRKLRYLTQAGGPMPKANIQRLRAQLPGARLFVMYGQTEAAARLSYLPPERLEDKLGSVGIAIPGVELMVQRADGTPANPNEVGEIIARGPNVMQGYLNDVPATREALRDGWLHTGDLGHCDDDGFFYIDGRAVEMIKVGAFRVSPQEVEEVIAAISGVQEVGVTAVPDELLGQAIKAVIVLKNGAHLDVRAVKAHCRQHLAMYKVPKLVEFAATLPYTATGKVRRLGLA